MRISIYTVFGAAAVLLSAQLGAGVTGAAIALAFDALGYVNPSKPIVTCYVIGGAIAGSFYGYGMWWLIKKCGGWSATPTSDNKEA